MGDIVYEYLSLLTSAVCCEPPFSVQQQNQAMSDVVKLQNTVFEIFIGCDFQANLVQLMAIRVHMTNYAILSNDNHFVRPCLRKFSPKTLPILGRNARVYLMKTAKLLHWLGQGMGLLLVLS